jgi:RHS repeat-associated protein
MYLTPNKILLKNRPFGMAMGNRKFVQTNKNYRYGFNGKEKDNEVKGEGNAYDFGTRIYDSRLGKFFSTDPMTVINPGESPFAFAGNNPIGLTDFEGLFKISPYFVKRYPTLAKILKNVLPLYINNIAARDNWIKAVGFDDQKAGQSAWEEMLTYGKGPWITPTLAESEIKVGGLTGASLWQGRFGNGSGNEWSEKFGYENNISFESFNLSRIESALKSGNDEEVAFNVFRSMILIMHESGHWARYMKAHKKNRTESENEDGALVEEAVFGRRFSYTRSRSADENADALRNDLIKQSSNGVRHLLKFFGDGTISNIFKKIKTPQGQIGDPVVKEAKINEGKVFTPASTKNTGGGSKGSKDYSY